jgi:hypothetical protein
LRRRQRPHGARWLGKVYRDQDVQTKRDLSRWGSFLLTDPLNWKAEGDAVLGGDSAKLGKSITCRSVTETGRREKDEEEEEDEDDDSDTHGEEPKPSEQEDDDEDEEDEEP